MSILLVCFSFSSPSSPHHTTPQCYLPLQVNARLTTEDHDRDHARIRIHRRTDRLRMGASECTHGRQAPHGLVNCNNNCSQQYKRNLGANHERDPANWTDDTSRSEEGRGSRCRPRTCSCPIIYLNCYYLVRPTPNRIHRPKTRSIFIINGQMLPTMEFCKINAPCVYILCPFLGGPQVDRGGRLAVAATNTDGHIILCRDVACFYLIPCPRLGANASCGHTRPGGATDPKRQGQTELHTGSTHSNLGYVGAEHRYGVLAAGDPLPDAVRDDHGDIVHEQEWDRPQTQPNFSHLFCGMTFHTQSLADWGVDHTATFSPRSDARADKSHRGPPTAGYAVLHTDKPP